MNISTVTVIGANGAMGSNVAGIFASFGNAKVYKVCRTKEKSICAIEKSVKSVKCDGIRDRLVASDYTKLEECVKDSDLVFESVSENFEIKKNILSRVSENLQSHTLLCTGTSGLSINELASVLPNGKRSNFFGMHMFNPPYNLRLCEMIPSKYTSSQILDNINIYAQKILCRRVVETTDTPGFLGNRIGFQFINKAIQYAEQYSHKGGVDYVDGILGKFTGRSMPPILTADFVGLDVHKSIVDYLYENTDDYAKEVFQLPAYVNTLIEQGKLGGKVGEGLYKTVVLDNKKTRYVFDIETKEYREKKMYKFEFIDQMRWLIGDGKYEHAYVVLQKDKTEEASLCLNILIDYVVYALITGKLAGKEKGAADAVMVDGFSWCPPSGIIKVLGGKTAFLKQVSQLYGTEFIEKENLENLVEEILDNLEYDYRRYIKA